MRWWVSWVKQAKAMSTYRIIHMHGPHQGIHSGGPSLRHCTLGFHIFAPRHTRIHRILSPSFVQTIFTSCQQHNRKVFLWDWTIRFKQEEMDSSPWHVTRGAELHRAIGHRKEAPWTVEKLFGTKERISTAEQDYQTSLEKRVSHWMGLKRWYPLSKL